MYFTNNRFNINWYHPNVKVLLIHKINPAKFCQETWCNVDMPSSQIVSSVSWFVHVKIISQKRSFFYFFMHETLFQRISDDVSWENWTWDSLKERIQQCKNDTILLSSKKSCPYQWHKARSKCNSLLVPEILPDEDNLSDSDASFSSRCTNNRATDSLFHFSF